MTDQREDVHQTSDDKDAISSQRPSLRDRLAEVPTMPKVAGMLSVLAPPVGAALGHLWLGWTKDELDAQIHDDDELDDVLRSRRWARAAIIIGWPMTFVMMFFGAYVVAQWDAEREEAKIAEIQEEQRERILAAAEDSTTKDDVTAPYCDVLIHDVMLESPATGFITEHSMIDEELVASYEQLAAAELPHSQAYANYASYLSSVDSPGAWEDMEPEEHAAHAEELSDALNDDALACVALDEMYLDALESSDDASSPSAQEGS